MSKLYRTAQGKLVDMGALSTQNERVRALGNMKVNARGDIVDNQNQPIVSRNQTVNKNYDRGVGKNAVIDPRVQEAQRQAEARAARQARRQNPQPSAPVADKPLEGLAAAMAKAQQIKDEE